MVPTSCLLPVLVTVGSPLLGVEGFMPSWGGEVNSWAQSDCENLSAKERLGGASSLVGLQRPQLRL